MWYKFAHLALAASKEEYLASIGVPEETIRHVMDDKQKDHIQYLINALSSNPSTPIPQLQSLVESRKVPEWTPWEIRLTQGYEEPYRTWALVQFRKQRLKYDPSTLSFNYKVDPSQFRALLNQIHDWFEAVEPNIASFDFAVAKRHSDDWHKAISGEGSDQYYEPDYHTRIVFGPEWPAHPEWEGWTIQEVKSQNDLTVEGNRMNHCVGGYGGHVERGYSRIYSLRDPRNNPKVTLEFDGKSPTIQQIFGNSNSEPDANYKAMLKVWFGTIDGVQMEDSDREYDYDDLHNARWRNIPGILSTMLYSGDEYGIENDISNFDLGTAYEKIMSNYSDRDDQYSGSMSETADMLAEVALKKDKKRLKAIISEGKSVNPSQWETLSAFTELEKIIDKNSENFSLNYYSDEPYPEEDDFETEEEYHAAVEKYEAEEREQADYYTENTLPYAYDAAMQNEITKLRNDPEYQQLLSQAVVVVEDNHPAA